MGDVVLRLRNFAKGLTKGYTLSVTAATTPCAQFFTADQLTSFVQGSAGLTMIALRNLSPTATVYLDHEALTAANMLTTAQYSIPPLTEKYLNFSGLPAQNLYIGATADCSVRVTPYAA